MFRDGEADKDSERRRERNIPKTMEINVKIVSGIHRIQFHSKKKKKKKKKKKNFSDNYYQTRANWRGTNTPGRRHFLMYANNLSL